MIKRNLLEARMKERGIWYSELVAVLGMKHYQTLHKRLVGKIDFKLWEVNAIRKLLNLSKEQADEIFYYEVEI